MAKPKEPKPITEKFGFVGGDALQALLDKQPDAITEDERDILRGRRSYLTPQQIENYGLEKPEGGEEGEETLTEEGEIRKVELNEMKGKDLKNLAKELEINVKKMKTEDIVTAILEAEQKKGESEEEKPEE